MGIVIHEVGHAIGFWHEHSRPDRNDHIEVLWENIKPLKVGNFRRHSALLINTTDSPYDIASIMHYGPNAFGKQSAGERALPTIRVVDPNYPAKEKMGQRRGLSHLDVRLARKLYRCDTSRSSALSEKLPAATISLHKLYKYCMSPSEPELCGPNKELKKLEDSRT